MDNREFKAIWQASEKKNLVDFEPEKLSKEIIYKLDKFNKKRKLNTYIEIVVAAIMIPFFAYVAFVIPFTLSKIGAVIIMFSMFLIIYKMIKSQNRKSDRVDLSLKEFLLYRKQQLIKQIKLIDSVLYWYILPPAVGVLVFVIGFKTSYLSIYFTATISVIVYAFIYFLNKRAIRVYFKPLLAELENIIDEIND